MHIGNLIITVLITGALSSCGMFMSGGTSEHGNERVAGVVLNRDGEPAEGVRVTLLPDAYNPLTDSARVKPLYVITGSDGEYLFDSLEPGSYTVQADDSLSGLSVIGRNIGSDTGILPVSRLMLDAPGSIFISDDTTIMKNGMIIYFPGCQLTHTVVAGASPKTLRFPSGRITIMGFDPVTRKNQDLGDQYVGIEILPGVTLILRSRSPKPYCVAGDSIVDCRRGYVGDEFVFAPVHPSNRIDGSYVYRFSWGDGSISEWSSDIRWSRAWDKPGKYFVQSQMMRQGQYLAWSELIYIEILEK